MRKNFLQTLLVVVLSVIGVSQCWAATYTTSPFTFVSYNSGSCGNSENPSISYNELNGTCSGTIDRYADDGGDGGCRMNLWNTAPSKNGVMNLFSYSRSVEPYTKVVLTYDYTLKAYTSGSHHTSVLYKFDDETTAKTTQLYFNNQTPTTGEKYRVNYLCSTEAGWKEVSGSTDFVFDNLAGLSTKSISKYIMLVVCEAHNALTPGTNLATFRCTSHSFAYTYRKIISFDGNGSTGGSMSDQDIDNKGNLTTNAFTRTGYTFNGWNTQANGTGTTYANGAEITATESDKGPVTLYAQWKRTVTLDAQSGTVSPTSIDVNCHSTYSNLPTPTRTGYTFNGWFDAKTGGNQYTTTTASTDEIPATLYAQWTRTVTIDKQDGTTTSSIVVNCNSTYENLPADPTRTGYTFNGWFDAKTGGSQYKQTTPSTNDIPETLYAQWNAVNYTITYNSKGGSEITEPKTYTIETPTFNLPKPTKNGYDFDGWFTDEDCTEGPITQIVKGSTENKTFYAKWTAITYNITYNVNGGSAITDHLTYTIETPTFDLPVPTKDGFTFGGWFTNEACTEGPITEITQGSIGDKEFYAKWSENVVSDGTGKTLNEAQNEVNAALSTWKQECDGGKPINLTINRTIYKDGYYNTLCLPFNMSADQISETFGTYKELKQFQSATVQGSGASRSIVIEVENATEIVAGKAYLISFEKGTDLATLTFNQVVVSTTEATDESGNLAYQGILAPFQLPYGDQNYLFLGEKNALYWAINDGTFMKGFRAYFKVNTNPASAPYRVGMRAAFGSRQTPTDLSPVVSGQEVRKLLEQGRVVIVNKGVKYNMNGAIVQ